MFWLFAVLSSICFVAAAGRVHSQYLDTQEARWTMLAGATDSLAHR